MTLHKSRKRTRLLTTTLVVTVASATVVAAGGGTAGAAPLPNAQAVGRLLDASLGGMPIQDLADLKDARATAPGKTSAQNPFDVTLFGMLNIPLTDVISIPTAPAADAGVANQVAQANLNGKSLGASGAVADDGGISAGDDNDGKPAFASVNVSAEALGSIPIPGLPELPGLPDIPGLPAGGADVAALGGIQASLGAVYAQVGTQAGGKVVTPKSGVASVQLKVGSPALGALLSQVKSVLDPAVLTDALSAVPGLAALLALIPGSDASDCALTSPSVDDISLAGGGVVVDVDTATITVDLGKLVKQLLDKDISKLTTSNFDLVSFLVTNLPKILSSGLTDLVSSVIDPLQDQFQKCITVLGPLGAAADAVIALINTGKSGLTGALDGLSEQFSAAADGPLSQLADALKMVVDIGLNVQSGPGIQPKEKTYPFESNLKATPSQNTKVVKNQTLVRAIEVQLLGGAGLGDAGIVPGVPGPGVPTPPGGFPDLPIGTLPPLPKLPGLPIGGGAGGNSAHVTQLAGNANTAVRPYALAPGDGAVNIALGNAAAGPSSRTSAPVPGTTNPNNPGTTAPAIPTGVPAGAVGSTGDSPALPLLVLLLGLTLAGGGYFTYRFRGEHTR